MRFDRLQKVLNDFLGELHSNWCVVDTENEFTFQGVRYKIGFTVENYFVGNKPVYNNLKWNDWTNETAMDKILCVNHGGQIKFYDENIDLVTDVVLLG